MPAHISSRPARSASVSSVDSWTVTLQADDTFPKLDARRLSGRFHACASVGRAEAEGQRYALTIMGLQLQGAIKRWMRVRSGAVNGTSTDGVSGCSLRIDNVSMTGVYWALVQNGAVQRAEVSYDSRARTEMWPSCVDGGFTTKHHGNIAAGV